MANGFYEWHGTQVSEAVLSVLQGEMQGGWATEAESKATIRDTFERTGYLLDPHTAVAKHVIDNAGHWRDDDPSVPVLISSTVRHATLIRLHCLS